MEFTDCRSLLCGASEVLVCAWLECRDVRLQLPPGSWVADGCSLVFCAPCWPGRVRHMESALWFRFPALRGFCDWGAPPNSCFDALSIPGFLLLCHTGGAVVRQPGFWSLSLWLMFHSGTAVLPVSPPARCLGKLGLDRRWTGGTSHLDARLLREGTVSFPALAPPSGPLPRHGD